MIYPLGGFAYIGHAYRARLVGQGARFPRLRRADIDRVKPTVPAAAAFPA